MIYVVNQNRSTSQVKLWKLSDQDLKEKKEDLEEILWEKESISHQEL